MEQRTSRVCLLWRVLNTWQRDLCLSSRIVGSKARRRAACNENATHFVTAEITRTSSQSPADKSQHSRCPTMTNRDMLFQSGMVHSIFSCMEAHHSGQSTKFKSIGEQHNNQATNEVESRRWLKQARHTFRRSVRHFFAQSNE